MSSPTPGPMRTSLRATAKHSSDSRQGLETWNDLQTDWGQLGTEHAAEIISWGLYMYCDPTEHDQRRKLQHL